MRREEDRSKSICVSSKEEKSVKKRQPAPDLNLKRARTKRARSDVEAVVYMAANNMKTSQEAQEELGLSKSQYNKRLRLIKRGEHRHVRIIVRCETCCRWLYGFDHIPLPTFGKKCDCDCNDC